MNRTQYENWKDFSIRMARVVYADSAQPTCEWIVGQVNDYFSGLETMGLEALAHVTAWDQANELGGILPCDYMAEREEELIPSDILFTPNETEFDETFLSPIRSCLRAGIDLACEPSAGVVGFTVGDIRKMYPRGIPRWVTENWTDFESVPDSADILL
jgi:hypothetical protein